MGFTACTEVRFAVHAYAATIDPGRWPPRRSYHMPERQHDAKIANEMADRLQHSAEVPRWNKSERQTIEEWAEDHEMTFAQAIRRLVELRLSSGKRSK